MNLRWLEKADGTKVLQIRSGESNGDAYIMDWRDVPTEKEPRLPREWTIWVEPGDRVTTRGSDPKSERIRVREIEPEARDE